MDPEQSFEIGKLFAKNQALEKRLREYEEAAIETMFKGTLFGSQWRDEGSD